MLKHNFMRQLMYAQSSEHSLEPIFHQTVKPLFYTHRKSHATRKLKEALQTNLVT